MKGIWQVRLLVALAIFQLYDRLAHVYKGTFVQPFFPCYQLSKNQVLYFSPVYVNLGILGHSGQATRNSGESDCYKSDTGLISTLPWISISGGVGD